MKLAFAFMAVSMAPRALPAAHAPRPSAPPNRVFSLADDLGDGEVRCYNPVSKVPTPNIDRLAREGLRFTAAPSPSPVCPPSRYSLLTGRRAFRLHSRRICEGVGGQGERPSWSLPNPAPEAPGQLYPLDPDPRETARLYFQHPEKVPELNAGLDASRAAGRSRPLLQPAPGP